MEQCQSPEWGATVSPAWQDVMVLSPSFLHISWEVHCTHDIIKNSRSLLYHI